MSPRPTGSKRRTRAVERPLTLSKEEIERVHSLVIHQDHQIIALNKPSGLSSQGGRGQGHTLDELLWAFAPRSGARPRLIHRLDRDTSGVILCGKTKPAASFLGKAVMARKLTKTYLAIVAPGGLTPAEGRIEVPLRREEVGWEAFMRVCAADHPDAEAALSYYRTLAATDDAALVELKPVTGRMHQLRVHMAHLGRPICGDPRYGGAMTLGGRPVPRLMLHALSLRFPHPQGGELEITAAPPADFAEMAAAAGLSGARQGTLQATDH